MLEEIAYRGAGKPAYGIVRGFEFCASVAGGGPLGWGMLNALDHLVELLEQRVPV